MESTYTNPNKIPIPTLVAKDFNVLHPALLMGSSGDDLGKIMTGLGIRPLSEEIIRKAVVQNQLPEIKEKWTSLSNVERMNWIKFFKEYEIDSRDLTKFITLPTKSKNWQRPESIIFSTQYHPDPDVEKLAEQGLLDAKDITESYLDPILVDGLKDPGIMSDWSSFLAGLGVGSPLTSNRLTHLAQRVATKATIRYEEARGNKAEELPESDSHIKGYDVISKSDSDIRLIEAKGRKTDREEITITHNQWRALLEHKDNYYVYVVTDALSLNPLLHPIKGTGLNGIEFSLRIQPATWKSASSPPTRYSSLKVEVS